jgi:two-component system response regulator
MSGALAHCNSAGILCTVGPVATAVMGTVHGISIRLLPRDDSMEDWNAVDILVAEDDDYHAELTLRALRTIQVVNKVLRVQDGVQALDFVFRQGQFADRDEMLPKLILLDLHMPKVDGLEVLRQLRESPTTQHIPVGILTSSSNHTDFFATQDLLVLDFVLKPVSSDALMDLIKQSGLKN